MISSQCLVFGLCMPLVAYFCYIYGQEFNSLIVAVKRVEAILQGNSITQDPIISAVKRVETSLERGVTLRESTPSPSWHGKLEKGDMFAEYFQARVPKNVLPAAKPGQCLRIHDFNYQLERSSPWRLFSHQTQDYVIDALFRHVGTTNCVYVEFGAPQRTLPWQSGLNADPLSNSKMLQLLHGWKGLLMDGGYERSDIFLKQEFITASNIVSLFDKWKVPKEPDFVSIDIDSCDLWVFFALTEVYRPRVVIVETAPWYKPDDAGTLSCGYGGVGTSVPSEFSAGWNAPFFEQHGLAPGGAKAMRLAARARGYTPVWLEPEICNDVIFVRDDLLCQNQTGLDFYQENFEQLINMLNCQDRDWRSKMGGGLDGQQYRDKYTLDFEKWLGGNEKL